MSAWILEIKIESKWQVLKHQSHGCNTIPAHPVCPSSHLDESWHANCAAHLSDDVEKPKNQCDLDENIWPDVGKENM
jgi:hypothetical protein